MSKAPPFDPMILAKAKEKFIEELQADIAFVKNALDTENSALLVAPEELAKLFHKVKGASGFLGMEALERQSGEVVKLCRDDNQSSQRDLIRNIAEWLKISSEEVSS